MNAALVVRGILPYEGLMKDGLLRSPISLDYRPPVKQRGSRVTLALLIGATHFLCCGVLLPRGAAEAWMPLFWVPGLQKVVPEILLAVCSSVLVGLSIAVAGWAIDRKRVPESPR